MQQGGGLFLSSHHHFILQVYRLALFLLSLWQDLVLARELEVPAAVVRRPSPPLGGRGGQQRLQVARGHLQILKYFLYTI